MAVVKTDDQGGARLANWTNDQARYDVGGAVVLTAGAVSLARVCRKEGKGTTTSRYPPGIFTSSVTRG